VDLREHLKEVFEDAELFPPLVAGALHICGKCCQSSVVGPRRGRAEDDEQEIERDDLDAYGADERADDDEATPMDDDELAVPGEDAAVPMYVDDLDDDAEPTAAPDDLALFEKIKFDRFVYMKFADAGPVPPELSNLNQIERRLISLLNVITELVHCGRSA